MTSRYRGAEDFNGEFYRFCKDHELRFQRCQDCGAWRHMPRESCQVVRLVQLGLGTRPARQGG